jgi:hypothetical protein
MILLRISETINNTLPLDINSGKGPFIIYDWGWAGKKRGWVMRYF